LAGRKYCELPLARFQSVAATLVTATRHWAAGAVFQLFQGVGDTCWKLTARARRLPGAKKTAQVGRVLLRRKKKKLAFLRSFAN